MRILNSLQPVEIEVIVLDRILRAGDHELLYSLSSTIKVVT